MALLRIVSKGKAQVMMQKRSDGSFGTVCHGIHDGIVETQADLNDPRCADFAPGSIILCLENSTFYVKGRNGNWSSMKI